MADNVDKDGLNLAYVPQNVDEKFRSMYMESYSTRKVYKVKFVKYNSGCAEYEIKTVYKNRDECVKDIDKCRGRLYYCLHEEKKKRRDVIVEKCIKAAEKTVDELMYGKKDN